MMVDRLDISDSLGWDEGLPRPRWDELQIRVEAAFGPDDRPAVWTDIARQWLEELRRALVPKYHLAESDHFLLLTWLSDEGAAVLLRFAEKCRRTLMADLPGMAAFELPGKYVVLTFKRPTRYYTYLSAYYPEGRHGGSAGVHVRQGRPHIAMWNSRLLGLESTLAHELTHAALVHLPTPLWVEEGLTQQFQRTLAEKRLLEVTGKMARRHKRYWNTHGLDSFWHGRGFVRPGKVQRLSYELAEVLQRLLAEEHRPRWFGLDKGPPGRLSAFLRAADKRDCGEAAARTHLGFGLADLALRFSWVWSLGAFLGGDAGSERVVYREPPGHGLGFGGSECFLLRFVLFLPSVGWRGRGSW